MIHRDIKPSNILLDSRDTSKYPMVSPDATDEQRSLAADVHVAIDQTRGWLIKAHGDARLLLAMDNDQIAQPATLTLLDDLVTQTQQAYVGQTDPTTGELHGGASWICSNILRLANFELKPFKTQ
jgi:serine/threonine protein kinase